MQVRPYRVGYRLLKVAVDDCGDAVRHTMGFYPLSSDMIPEPRRRVYSEALGLTEQVRVLAVNPGSAAEAAGLRVGDIIHESSWALIPRADSKESREDSMKRLPGPLALNIVHDGVPMPLTLTPDVTCDYELLVQDSGEVNAFANGEAVAVTRGVMRFATDDRELALVVGHELGQHGGPHHEKEAELVFGALFDILAAAGVNTQGPFMQAGAAAYSQAIESEAAYVGAVLRRPRRLRHPQRSRLFWRRMGAEQPGSIRRNHAATRPATMERFLALEQVAGEIEDKRSKGLRWCRNVPSSVPRGLEDEGRAPDAGTLGAPVGRF
ncbi:MAG: M48 family metalloprotease [Pseudomonadota bacterium]